MKPLQRRVKKLETKQPSIGDLPIMFVTFVSVDGHENLSMASIPGTDFGKIRRGENETEDAFRRRVYAMKVLNEQLDEMTNEELENALAAGCDSLAKELAETGSISDESLEKASGRLGGTK